MNIPSKYHRKVVVVGAGMVGSTFSFALAQSGLADEIVLIDKNESLAQGQVLDLVHGQSFFPTVSIRYGDRADYADAQVIVVTAGRAQRPGETRLQLLQKNAAIMRSIAADVLDQDSSAVMLVVTNPVDIMTHIALRWTGWDKGRVLGSGTVLDSARLRHLLGTLCGVDVHNVHGYILGEHGDSEFAAWSMTNLAGIPIDAYCPLCRRCEDWAAERAHVEEIVRNSAYHIIDYKGATYYAVSLVLVAITGAVLRGQNSVLTVSTMLEGEFHLANVCLSVPSIVSAGGVEKVIEGPLSDGELAALAASAAAVKQAIQQLG